MLQQKSLLDGPFKFNLKKNTIVYDQNLFEQEIMYSQGINIDFVISWKLFCLVSL